MLDAKSNIYTLGNVLFIVASGTIFSSASLGML